MDQIITGRLFVRRGIIPIFDTFVHGPVKEDSSFTYTHTWYLGDDYVLTFMKFEGNNNYALHSSP